MNRIILAGFDGEDNTAKLMTERTDAPCRKLVLPNDKELSVDVLMAEIHRQETGCVVLLGQKPRIKNKIAIERCAVINGVKLCTPLDVTVSTQLIRNSGYAAYISENCGTSYCNHIYGACLENGINCIFLHVPYMKNTDSLGDICRAVGDFVNGVAGIPCAL